MAALRWLGLLGLVACSSDPMVLRPVLDSPTDLDAAAFPDLDAVTLTIAHAGSNDDLVSQTFERGSTIELAGVPFGDDLVLHMSGRIGTNEVAYGRTCTFAMAANATPPTPHLFFSRIVKFAATEVPAVPRTDGRALTYHDGSALFVGGVAGGGPQLAVEQFDPRRGSLDVVTQIAGRTQFAEAALGAGEFQIALIGGTTDGTTGAGFFEVFEADNPRVDQFSDNRMGRVELTATALTDGRVVVIGGRIPETAVPSGAIVTLELVGGAPETRTLRAVLATPRAGHTATRLGDDVGAPVLVAGGLDATGQPVAMAELWKPLSEDLANAATFHPTMVVPRTRHRAVLLPDGSVLFIGGLDAAGNPLRSLERFSIDSGFTLLASELPASAGVLDATVTTLPDGRVLLIGGRASPGGPPLDTAFIARLDPIDGAVDVVQTDRLALPRAGHQATALCDGTILVAGGADTTLVERYNPPSLSRR